MSLARTRARPRDCEASTRASHEVVAAEGTGAKRCGGTGRSVVQVIDPKRANNGGIILARLRMSYDDMAMACVEVWRKERSLR